MTILTTQAKAALEAKIAAANGSTTLEDLTALKVVADGWLNYNPGSTITGYATLEGLIQTRQNALTGSSTLDDISFAIAAAGPALPAHTPYLRLNGLQAGFLLDTNSSSTFITPGVNIASLNINNASFIQICNVDVPEGRALVLVAALLQSIGTTGNLDFEIEIDGVTVVTRAIASYTLAQAFLVGPISSTALTQLLVRNNLKIRARRTGASSAALALTYFMV